MSRTSLADQALEDIVQKLNEFNFEYKAFEDAESHEIEHVELKWITSLASGQRVPELHFKFKDSDKPIKYSTYNTIWNVLKFIYMVESEIGEENGNQA